MDKGPHKFFVDFEQFGRKLNEFWMPEKLQPGRESDDIWGGLPFRLQEYENDEPYGWYTRQYHIFYNQLKLGDLEIWADFDYSEEKPNVAVKLQLSHVQLLPFDMVWSFIDWVSIYCVFGNRDERIRARDEMSRAFLRSASPSTKRREDFRLCLDGTAKVGSER